MCTGRSLVVVAALALAGCVTTEEGDGGDLMLRVRISGGEISSVEVIDRAAPDYFEHDFRPQVSGDMGIIWTDFESGETLAEGWMPPMQTDQFDLVVPAPGDDGALLTVTLPTRSGPFIVTAHVAP